MKDTSGRSIEGDRVMLEVIQVNKCCPNLECLSREPILWIPRR